MAHGDLYSQLYLRDNLLQAWQAIKAKGSSGGIDGVSVEIFGEEAESNLQQLQDELAAKRFVPRPYKTIDIPKNEGEKRQISLMSIRDKIVQQAARGILEPILERMFLDVSYAYRAGKSTRKAIGRVHHMLINEKREWLVSCDIDAYFDSINHDRLMSMLGNRINDKELLALIRTWLRMGRINRDLKWSDSTVGIPQGGIISPLLSNFYLTPFDRFCVNNKYGLVRYADDFVILARTKDEAQKALDGVRTFLLGKLGLRLNEGHHVRNVSESFQFLGLVFQGTERGITDAKLASIQDKIRQAVVRDGMKSDVSVQEALQGIGAYYGMILPQRFLEPMDEALFTALKEEARKRYEGGETTKKDIAAIIGKIDFLSQHWKLNRKREIRELLAYCRKRPRPDQAASVKAGAVQCDPVKKRKREYQKLESAGFELLVSTSGSFIGKTQKGVVVKVKGVVVHQAPLNCLKHIFITASGVSLSSNVISWAAKNKIPIDFCQHSGEPYARLHPFHATNYSLQKAQLAAEGTGKASELAKSFVLGKIKNQMNLMKYYHKYRKNFDEDFVREFDVKLGRMEQITEEIKVLEDDSHDLVRGKLFSIEGRAAAAYWDTVTILLDDMIVFDGRVGQGAKDLVNSLLNYGYGILYGKIWNAVIRAGLTPYISFLHVPQSGKPTLIFDLIEEFRPQAVDRVVYSMINKRVELKMDGNMLSAETRKKLAAEVLERVNSVERFRGRELRLYEIIQEQARNVAAFLCGDLPKYSPYVAKW